MGKLLIYDEPDFEVLRERAERFGFSSTRAMEHLRWDYEFVAQLQRLDGNLVLRGGAAAQLYVAVPLQRASLDVDFITSVPLDQIRRKVEGLTESLAPLGVIMVEHVPRRPVAGLEQATYHVHFPKAGGSGGTRRIKLEIQKVPFRLPWNFVSGRETLALVAEKAKCVTIGALVGDKLTTLAPRTIGVRLADQPKQVYDLTNLAFDQTLSTHAMGDLRKAFLALVRHECKMKGLEDISPSVVLDDIERALTTFSRVDLPSESPSPEIKKSIRDFEAFYVGKSGWTGDSGWALKGLKLRFLVRAIRNPLIGHKQADAQVANLLREAKSLEIKAKKSADSASAALLKTLDGGRKALEGRSVERLLWEAVDPSNLLKVEATIGAGE